MNCDQSCAGHTTKWIIVHVVIGCNLFIISFLPYDRAGGAPALFFGHIKKHIGMAVGSWVPLYIWVRVESNFRLNSWVEHNPGHWSSRHSTPPPPSLLPLSSRLGRRRASGPPGAKWISCHLLSQSASSHEPVSWLPGPAARRGARLETDRIRRRAGGCEGCPVRRVEVILGWRWIFEIILGWRWILDRFLTVTTSGEHS